LILDVKKECQSPVLSPSFPLEDKGSMGVSSTPSKDVFVIRTVGSDGSNIIMEFSGTSSRWYGDLSRTMFSLVTWRKLYKMHGLHFLTTAESGYFLDEYKIDFAASNPTLNILYEARILHHFYQTAAPNLTCSDRFSDFLGDKYYRPPYHSER